MLSDDHLMQGGVDLSHTTHNVFASWCGNTALETTTFEIRNIKERRMKQSINEIGPKGGVQLRAREGFLALIF